MGQPLLKQGEYADFTLNRDLSLYVQVTGTAELGSLELSLQSWNFSISPYGTWRGSLPPDWFQGSRTAWSNATRVGSRVINDVPFGFRYLSGVPSTRQVLTAEDRETLPQVVESAGRLELHYRVDASRSQGFHYGAWLEPAVSNGWQSALAPEPVAGKPGFMKVSVPLEPGRTRLLRLRLHLP